MAPPRRLRYHPTRAGTIQITKSPANRGNLTVVTPHKGRKLTKSQKAHNRMVNSVRGPGERGFAVLKSWRIFAKVRCCPRRVGPMAKAVLALELGPES